MDGWTWHISGANPRGKPRKESAATVKVELGDNSSAFHLARKTRRSASLKFQQNGSLVTESNSATDKEKADSTDKVKTKLLSMWNNMKYGWTVRVRTTFNKDSPVWFLGLCYHRKLSDSNHLEAAAVAKSPTNSGMSMGLEGFKSDFISRIWFTYRREFPTLAGSSLTTDCGWGCMLRSGQMLLAQGLVNHFLGRGWRWEGQQPHDEQELIHRQIIRWFGDWHIESSPFSIHQLVAFGECSGKKAGDWYGPASVAHILKQAVEKAAEKFLSLCEICVYVAQDCAIYRQDVLDICYRNKQSGSSLSGAGTADKLLLEDNKVPKWRSVVILVPVRLGGDILNSIYVDCMKAILSNEYSIGIIGGRPKHSLYFVGWQDDRMIHLDPHYCQEMIDVREPEFPLQSFHCTHPRKMAFSHMDPSCTLGFYCKTPQDLEIFLESCKEVLTPSHSQMDYPLFVVADGKGEECESLPMRYLSSFSSVSSNSAASKDQEYVLCDEDEEFVFL